MRKLSFLLIALVACFTFTRAEIIERVNIGDLYFNLDTENKTAEVTSENDGYWSTKITTADIPSSVPYNDENYSVTSIGNYAFWDSDLTSVTIGNSVTSIGERAFADCRGLISVTIGNSVTSIGDDTFRDCANLTSVNLPNNVTSIGDRIFYGCTGLTEPVFNSHIFAAMPTSYNGSYTIPDGIETIAGGAFGWCLDLTSVEIPNTVTSIGNGAFFSCTDLTSVTIPNSVTSIGIYAFYNCSGLTSIICKAVDLPTLGDEVFSGVPKNIPLYVPDGKESAYNDADQWKEFDIKPISAIPTGMESVQTSDVRSQKLLRDGQLLILRDGKTYNTMGGEVK